MVDPSFGDRVGDVMGTLEVVVGADGHKAGPV